MGSGRKRKARKAKPVQMMVGLGNILVSSETWKSHGKTTLCGDTIGADSILGTYAVPLIPCNGTDGYADASKGEVGDECVVVEVVDAYMCKDSFVSLHYLCRLEGYNEPYWFPVEELGATLKVKEFHDAHGCYACKDDDARCGKCAEMDDFKKKNAALQTELADVKQQLDESQMGEKKQKAETDKANEKCESLEAELKKQKADASRAAEQHQQLINETVDVKNKLENTSKELADTKQKLSNHEAVDGFMLANSIHLEIGLERPKNMALKSWTQPAADAGDIAQAAAKKYAAISGRHPADDQLMKSMLLQLSTKQIRMSKNAKRKFFRRFAHADRERVGAAVTEVPDETETDEPKPKKRQRRARDKKKLKVTPDT